MSRLRRKLDTLREQGGAVSAPAACPALEEADLRRRLVRRGRGRGGDKPRDAELARWLGGRSMAEGLILIERCLPAQTKHGRDRIDAGSIAEGLDFFGNGTAPEAAVFMDTETSGLAGGTGTVVFLLGLARFIGAGLTLRQYLLTGFGGEAALLAHSGDFLGGANTLVSYNGKCFDSPLLQTRYRLAGLGDPLADMQHLDLLHTTRRAFARRWPDCRLQSAERRLLGFVRDNDLPGAEVPAVWFNWLRHGLTADLPRVIEHNHWDLVSLAALLPALRQSFEQPLRRNADVLAGAKHYLGRQQEQRAYEHLTAHRRHLDPAALLELARLGKRRGQWRLAVDIWRELAERDNTEALERLAIHCEHQTRDPTLALAYTRRLIRLQPDAFKHRRRERRLLAKR